MGNWGRRRKESRISIYKSKAPADNGTLRRGTTSDERKARPCWRFHCPAWWSNSQENMQINYLQRLTRKLRLVLKNGAGLGDAGVKRFDDGGVLLLDDAALELEGEGEAAVVEGEIFR